MLQLPVDEHVAFLFSSYAAGTEFVFLAFSLSKANVDSQMWFIEICVFTFGSDNKGFGYVYKGYS